MATIVDEPTIDENDIFRAHVLTIRLSEPFEKIAALNPELRIEQNADGEIVIMTPAGGESSYRNATLAAQLVIWAETFGGVVFDSSAAFRLPNGAKRSPDVSWITIERWKSLSKKERRKFPPLCPDFAIELRSDSDRLDSLREKMDEYLANGLRLGWLIDPLKKRVHIYRPDRQPEILDAPMTLSEEAILPGFVLDMRKIWDEE